MVTTIADLRSDLGKIRSEVIHIAHMDDVFWQIQAVIQSNPAIDRPGIIQDWIARAYSDSVLAGLRRLGDRRRDNLSLWRVLESMKACTSLITRVWYVEMHEAELKRLANEWFDDLIGVGKRNLNSATISEKQKELEAALESVVNFANENITHLAAKPTGAIVTFLDVRKALARAFRVFTWCSRLLDSTVPLSAVPVNLENWLKDLRVPWLPEGAPPPSYKHLDEVLREDSETSV